jgi:hypothetical protein
MFTSLQSCVLDMCTVSDVGAQEGPKHVALLINAMKMFGSNKYIKPLS